LSDLSQEEKNLLGQWAQNFKISLSQSQVHLLGIYLAELLRWNKKINLTGLSSRQGIIKDLLLDSLIPAFFLPNEGRLLDVGSGAGFPAIPLKICRPGLKAHLLESRTKRVNFLRQVLRLTRLPEIEVIRGRIEKDGGILDPQGYHAITARAFAHLPKALAYCAPHLASGGMIVSFQGSQRDKTIKESTSVIEELNLNIHKTISYALPGKVSQRHIVIFKKS